MQPEMSFEGFVKILEKVKFRDWELRAIKKGNDAYLLQWIFMEKDVMNPGDETLYPQHCRKWYVSKFSTVSEVIRTSYLAVQQAIAHEVSETFMYDNIRLFDPHTDYTLLAKYMQSATQDVRE